MRLACLFALALLLGLAQAGAQEARTLTVSGLGEVAARPDIAVLQFGIVVEAQTPAEALAQAGTRAERVLSQLRAAGLEDRDLQTSRVAVQPRTVYLEGRAPRIEGYLAQNQVEARIRPAERAGGILDTVVRAGANNVAGLAFEVSDRRAKLDEARAAAVRDARLKAELYASALGVRLGPVRSFQEAGASSPRPVRMRLEARADAASTPVEPGEESITAEVSAVFDIEER